MTKEMFVMNPFVDTRLHFNRNTSDTVRVYTTLVHN
jgi:hypothetical protein